MGFTLRRMKVVTANHHEGLTELPRGLNKLFSSARSGLGTFTTAELLCGTVASEDPELPAPCGSFLPS